MKKLLAFILTFAASVAELGNTAGAVSEKVLRLHVMAASDSAEDQELKLLARDGVLEYLTPLLAGCGSQGEAAAVAEENLPAIARAAAEASGQRASVSLVREDFPAREYENVALPAGEYLALRIELEGGAGRNWWCVVFPPLCTALTAQDEEDAFAIFDEEEAELISGKGRVIKFRLLEWLKELVN